MVKSRKRLAKSSHKKFASDSSPKEEQLPPDNQVADEDDDDVIDPDPIRWALPADGKPVATLNLKSNATFNEVQLVHMYHLGHKVGWSLKEYQKDRTILTNICSEIGIDRGKFRAWVFRKKNQNDKVGSSGTGSGRSDGNLNNEGDSSSTE